MRVIWDLFRLDFRTGAYYCLIIQTNPYPVPNFYSDIRDETQASAFVVSFLYETKQNTEKVFVVSPRSPHNSKKVFSRSIKL